MAESGVPKQTVAAQTWTSFGRSESGLSLIGILTPVDSFSGSSQVRIEGEYCLIGRGPKEEGINLQLNDENVSRRHARIRRRANHFVIEDLGSSNGTFVDGIPISSALIHDGDRIQIGRSGFHFDHLYEFSGEFERSLRGGDARPCDWTDTDSMALRFWGTRGSLPTPGPETYKYGGNTTCVEVRYQETLVVIDAGSGIRELSTSWLQEFGDRALQVQLLFTHLHWDHIQGFPFFSPAYVKGNKIDIYGSRRSSGSIEALLSGQMQGAYFPVPLSAMAAELDFYDSLPKFTIDNLSIEAFELPHPGGSLGYRFCGGDSVLVFATDCELDRVASNQHELRQNHHAPRIYDDKLLHAMQDADLLVIDCQYSDEEYRRKVGWGHNSIATVVDLCEQVRPKMLALTHHDPTSTDAMVTQRALATSERLMHRGIHDTLVFGAREQLCLPVKKPKRPLRPASP